MYNPNSSQRKRIITISGTPCSGKSTVNTILAQELGYQTHSIGSWVKQLALESGLTPEAFYKQNEIEINGQKRELDQYLDPWQQQLGEQKERFILDSRLGFYFVPQSFRVFLSCDFEVAAQRIHQIRSRNPAYASAEYETIEKARETIEKRTNADERKNYAEKYGIPDFRLPFHFDLPIDTTTKAPEEVAKQILEQYLKYEKVTGEIERSCWALMMVVAKSHTYMSGPITGSRSLYETMKEHGVRRKEDLPKEAYDRIRQENVDRSRRIEQEWVAKYDSPVLLPEKLGSADIWSQRDYVDLSKEVMRLKATEFVFEDGWEYSNGSVEEFLLALTLKKPMLDQRRNPLNKEQGIHLLTTSVEEIHQASLECPKLDFLLEQLRKAA